VAQLPCASHIAAHYATADVRQVQVGHFPSKSPNAPSAKSLTAGGSLAS
jgi:hypothetical protein